MCNSGNLKIPPRPHESRPNPSSSHQTPSPARDTTLWPAVPASSGENPRPKATLKNPHLQKLWRLAIHSHSKELAAQSTKTSCGNGCFARKESKIMQQCNPFLQPLLKPYKLL